VARTGGTEVSSSESSASSDSEPEALSFSTPPRSMSHLRCSFSRAMFRRRSAGGVNLMMSARSFSFSQIFQPSWQTEKGKEREYGEEKAGQLLGKKRQKHINNSPAASSKCGKKRKGWDTNGSFCHTALPRGFKGRPPWSSMLAAGQPLLERQPAMGCPSRTLLQTWAVARVTAVVIKPIDAAKISWNHRPSKGGDQCRGRQWW
jgi:hypothetical protein